MLYMQLQASSWSNNRFSLFQTTLNECLSPCWFWAAARPDSELVQHRKILVTSLLPHRYESHQWVTSLHHVTYLHCQLAHMKRQVWWITLTLHKGCPWLCTQILISKHNCRTYVRSHLLLYPSDDVLHNCSKNGSWKVLLDHGHDIPSLCPWCKQWWKCLCYSGTSFPGWDLLLNQHSRNWPQNRHWLQTIPGTGIHLI